MMEAPAAPENPPTLRSVRAWYDERYAAMGEQAMRPAAAYRGYLEELDPRPGDRLLDVSCGAGHLLAAARERGLAATGLDLSFDAARIARRVAPGSDVTVGDGQFLPFATDSFDRVSCIGSLEHFPDPAAALREMLRVARPGARFCLVVPNSDFLPWRWSRPGTEQRDLLEQPRPLAGWRRLFEGAGLAVLAVSRDPWHLKRLRSRSALLRVCERAALRIAWIALPLRWTYQVQFRLEKPERSIPATGARS